MIHCRTIYLTLGVAFLGGCASTAGSARYENLAAKYDQTLNDHPSGQRTEASALTQPTLGRVEFVQQVLRQNPNIETARHALRAALARVRSAGGFEDPMVDVGVAPLSIGSNARIGYEVGISQQLPWFGKRSLETQAMEAEAAANASDFEATKRDLALNAVTLYNQYFIAARSIEINQRHIALMESFHRSAVAQFEAGRGSAQDPLQAEAELAELERSGVVTESERDITVALMNELLHRDPSSPLPPPPKTLALPIDSDSETAKQDRPAQRPEIDAANERAAAEQARADRAGRDAYPDITLSTAYNSMMDMPEHRWTVGVAFNLPIQTGARTGAKEEALALRSQFQSEARSMENSARREVFVARKELQQSRAVLDVFEKKLLPIAKNQIDAASAGFVASRNPFTAVIDAAHKLHTAELDYQTARAAFVTRRAELDRALGRVPGLDWKEEQQ